MVTFAGFPLGAVCAKLIVGPVDGPGGALAGGFITGAVLGAFQSWALGYKGSKRSGWIALTAVGLMAGLGIGAAAVDYQTSLGNLITQGAVCGLAVGIAQAWALRPELGKFALAWPPALAGIWAIGWAITSSAGIKVDEQFTVFGSSGAVVVTALTAVLRLAINRRGRVRHDAPRRLRDGAGWHSRRPAARGGRLRGGRGEPRVAAGWSLARNWSQGMPQIRRSPARVRHRSASRLLLPERGEL